MNFSPENKKSQDKVQSPFGFLQQKAENYFSQPSLSTSFIAAKKFLEKYIITEIVSQDLLINTPDKIEQLFNYIQGILRKLHPTANTLEIISELKNSGIIIDPIIEKKQKPEKVFEELETSYQKIEGFKQAELDEDQVKIIEANLLDEEIKKSNISLNSELIQELYEKTKFLERGTDSSKREFYDQFIGLVKGGNEEVQGDFEALQKVKEIFSEKIHSNPEQQKKLDQAKQIATLTERSFVYAVTKLQWYGPDVKMNLSSEFDDIKRGIDGTLEIVREHDENDFLGIGIDVTFRGLDSEEFRQKLFKLLASIRDGHKSRVKYGVDYQGNTLSEFVVPKVLACFDLAEVKELISILQSTDDQQIQEVYKNSSQKFKIMRQIIHQCQKLSSYAKECKNGIFRNYNAVVNSFTELSWKNPEIKKVFELEQNDPALQKIDELFKEFLKLEKPLT